MKWKLIILAVIAVLISGCHSDAQESKISQNYYQLKTDTLVENYCKLSSNGNDYIYPNFKSKTWSDTDNLDNESLKMINEKNESEFYVIRKNYLNFSHNYSESLDGDEIKKTVNKEIKKYVGRLQTKNRKINYVNDIKFYDEYGSVQRNNSKRYYYMICFQSELDIPSIGHYKVPTVMIMKYKNKKDLENVKSMFTNLKQWMLRTE